MTEKTRIGVLISGTGSNMKAIVNACQSGMINGEVVCVGADNPEAKGLEWARDAGIPTFVVNYREIRDAGRRNGYWPNLVISGNARAEYYHELSVYVHGWFNGDREEQIEHIRWKLAAETLLLRELKKFKIDLLALAGFMQVCTSFLIDALNNEVMNIHPALLPAFPGTDGYGDTFRHGCKIGGCTVHFIDEGEDTGPYIGQRSFPIRAGDTLEIVKRKGLTYEWELYPYCISLYAEGRLRVVDNGRGRKVVVVLDEDQASDFRIVFKEETHNTPTY